MFSRLVQTGLFKATGRTRTGYLIITSGNGCFLYLLNLLRNYSWNPVKSMSSGFPVCITIYILSEYYTIKKPCQRSRIPQDFCTEKVKGLAPVTSFVWIVYHCRNKITRINNVLNFSRWSRCLMWPALPAGNNRPADHKDGNHHKRCPQNGMVGVSGAGDRSAGTTGVSSTGGCFGPLGV